MPISEEDRRQERINKARAKVNLFELSAEKITVPAPSNTFGNVLNEPQRGAQDNPQFIWPGDTSRDMGVGRYKPVRGYIRRLNEFYKNMSDDKTLPNSIINRRCNFQIQPDSVIRNVSANAIDTQFFFNQEPSQLSVPIPGQSTYTLTLLFNREPEVASGKYMSKGQLIDGQPRSRNFNGLTSDVSNYLNGVFQPSWVTQLGVYVDIMVLDAIIGQGINKETLMTIQKIASAQNKKLAEEIAKDATNTTDARYKDEQDKATAAAAAGVSYWSSEGDNPNIGNTAFLVPTPVRIMMSNTMMIEGFIMSSNVNFHKFSRDFIPTQCRVDLQIQALYVGFAKNNTLLTTPVDVAGGNKSDQTSVDYNAVAVEKATLAGISSLYKSVEHHKAGKDLLNYLLNVDPQQGFNFTLALSDEGKIYRIRTLGAANGGAPSFNWEGEILINWNSFVSGASNARQPTRSLATGGTGMTQGFPTGFEYWGTDGNPLVIAKGSGKIYEDELGAYEHVIGDNDTDAFGLSKMTEAKWDMYLPPAIASRPFTQDKFRVRLNITITLERFGIIYVVAQKVIYDNIVTCDEAVLFKGLSFAKDPGPTDSGVGGRRS